MDRVRTTTGRLSVAPFVFFPAAVVTVVLVAITLAFPAGAGQIFGGATDFIVKNLGWFFHAVVVFSLLVVVLVPFGRTGTVVLGRSGERPEFGTPTWLSMLFSAGMGIGLLFFGVAEPLLHYGAPPWGAPESSEARRIAMGVTFFHWGFHAWAVYTLVSLSLAFFAFRKGLPLSIRSCLYPLLGDKIYGRIGDMADLLAVFGTLFGLATSLGLGAKQIGAGVAHLFDVDNSTGLQIALICLITGAATLSLLSGLKRGVRFLSEVTVAMALVLLVFVLFVGPLGEADAAGDLRSYAAQALYAVSSSPRGGDVAWQAGWTVFYWAWWIAWAPFVGTFVARISRGRTVREFVVGVLVVPVCVTLVWLYGFGESALALENEAPGTLLPAVQKDASLALFAFLERLPGAEITSVLGLSCVALFFVTSSDSGSFVVDVLTSGGKKDPPVWQRVFWATLEGAIACALLWGGGLRALQSAAIATGLPFAIVLVAAGVGIVKALRNETKA